MTRHTKSSFSSIVSAGWLVGFGFGQFWLCLLPWAFGLFAGWSRGGHWLGHCVVSAVRGMPDWGMYCRGCWGGLGSVLNAGTCATLAVLVAVGASQLD